jgi:hypothetical protein
MDSFKPHLPYSNTTIALPTVDCQWLCNNALPHGQTISDDDIIQVYTAWFGIFIVRE